MLLRNTLDRFGVVHKGFHWVMALLVIGMIVLGLSMTRIDPPTPTMFQLYGLHKSIGITVLLLAVLRVLWRVTNIRPLSLPSHQRWEKILAEIVHGLLYLALLVMPLSGWLMSSAKGFSVSVFGWFTLPDLIKPSDDMAALMVTVHEVAAYTLIVMLGLHVAGALKHHLIDRDDTLRRMIPFGRLRQG